METKTGYGLTVADEVRAGPDRGRRAGFDEITFLGAHVVPPEFAEDPDGYVDLVCGPMLDAVGAAGRWIDVFCESGAFDEAQSRRVLAAGAADGTGPAGARQPAGARTRRAARGGARRGVGRPLHLPRRDRTSRRWSASSTVATLLPACDLSTRQPPAPGARCSTPGPGSRWRPTAIRDRPTRRR